MYWIRMSCAIAVALSSGVAWADEAQDCHAGVYRFADGNLLDIGPDGDGLRWRTLDGRTGLLSRDPQGGWASHLGWTKQPDGVAIDLGTCKSRTIHFDGRAAQGVALTSVDGTFESGGVKLVGRLVLPPGSAKVPVMVVGHGSERTSALINAFKQRLYPAAGVGVFVYDKRGTGKSGGKYSQDFNLLADDAAAAMAEARRLGGGRVGRIGFEGGSQAGWVLPLAAQRAPADFVIIGYGIAASPLVEDRTETFQDLSAAGWGADVLVKAREVTDATGTVVSSHFTSGYDQLRSVVARYGKEPWFKDLKGEFTGKVVKYPEAVLRSEGPKQDDGTTWNFDAIESLRRLRSPLLWMIAADDTEGPGPETKQALMQLRAAGKAITVAEFPNTEHGIHLLRTSGSAREQVGYAPGYFQMELEFARKGRLSGHYPDATVANT